MWHVNFEWRLLEHKGLSFALKKTLSRLLDNPILRQYVVYSADLAEAAMATPADVRIHWATEADRNALNRLGFDSHILDKAFQGDGRIAVLEDRGVIVAGNCYWTDPISVGVLTFGCPLDAVVASNGFVDPAFRGLRYLAATKAFAAREFQASGYLRMVSVSRWRNIASRHAHTNAKARPLFRVVVLRCPFGSRLVWATGTLSIGRWSTANPKFVAIT